MTTFKFIEEVHNFPAAQEISSVAYKQLKQNEGASGKTGFRPNLSISPVLSVSSLLFFCFTALRECCWSGAEAGSTHAKDGKARSCFKRVVGVSHSNLVYKFVWSSCEKYQGKLKDLETLEIE